MSFNDREVMALAMNSQNNTSSIATINSQLAEITTYEDDAYIVLNMAKDNGVFVVIGDSISEGYGLYGDYTEQYVTKLQQYFNSKTGYGDFETITNFGVSGYGLQYNGSYSIGTKGPSQKSIILQPNATITFTGIAQYIDFIYHRNPSAGLLEVYKNDTLYKTIDCSGVDTLDFSSFPTASSGSAISETYTIKCITASVEISAIVRIVSKVNYGNTNVIRCAVSGKDSAYFSTNEILDSISAVSAPFNSSGVENKIYLLAVGTNDIYNATLKKPASSYYNNMKKIVNYLLDDTLNVRIILTVPAIASSAFTPYESINKYRNVLYQLASEYNLAVIDYTNIDFIGLELYLDGVHPNIDGHKKMYEYILKTLAIDLPKPKKDVYAEITAGSQSINSAAFTSISFNTEVKDTGDMFDTSIPTKIYIKTAGFYDISAFTEFATNSTGVRGIALKINNSAYFGNVYMNAVNGATNPMITAIKKYFNAGDYIELQIYQTSGAALNSLASRFSIFKIAS